MIDDEDPVETPDEEILAAACGMLRTGDRFLVCVAHIGDTQVYIEEEKGKPVPQGTSWGRSSSCTSVQSSSGRRRTVQSNLQPRKRSF